MKILVFGAGVLGGLFQLGFNVNFMGFQKKRPSDQG